jgi:sodium-dependent dicarboxylate transporter 2/3/5
MAKEKQKATGYDKYVNWKLFIIPVVLFFAILVLPTPYGMKDVGTEVTVGPGAVVNLITTELFGKKSWDAAQWELLTAEIMEKNMGMGALSKSRFLKRDLKWCNKYKIQADAENLKKANAFIKENIDDTGFTKLMNKAIELRKEGLVYEKLTEKERNAADTGAWHIKVAVAMMVFVVFCFMTECIPLPGVAFCIGLILVFTGVVTRKEVAMLYWDDACWFIMGSLMFAAAFVKTGVDKRMCLMMFKKLAAPSTRVGHPDLFYHHRAFGRLHFRPCPGRHVSAHRHAALSEQPDRRDSRRQGTGQNAHDRHCHGLQHRGPGCPLRGSPKRHHDDLSQRHVRLSISGTFSGSPIVFPLFWS